MQLTHAGMLLTSVGGSHNTVFLRLRKYNVCNLRREKSDIVTAISIDTTLPCPQVVLLAVHFAVTRTNFGENYLKEEISLCFGRLVLKVNVGPSDNSMMYFPKYIA